MKKLTLLFVMLVLSGSTKLHAQKVKGQSVVGAGVGYSLAGALINSLVGPTASTAGFDYSSIPVIAGSYDYAITEKFSLGAAVSYQSFTLKYNDFQTIIGYDNTGYPIYGTTSFKETITRVNYALRPLIHFGKNEDLDMYTGIRLGLTKWGYKSDNATVSGVAGDLGTNFAPQALFGTRYFFSEMIGVNFEFGIGAPYFIMAGVAVRL